MPRRVLTLEQQHVIQALVHDVGATIGLKDEAEFTAWLLAQGRDALEKSRSKTDLASFRDELVADFQQGVHDEFIDVSWPRCPRHPNHPMWLQDGAWWCTKDDVRIAKLGALPSRQTMGR